MKISRVLTICFVVCCLFTSNAFSQCTVGQNITLEGELVTWGSGITALVAAPGDVIYYTVTIDRTGLCDLEEGEVQLTLPDGSGGAGTVFDLADNLNVLSGNSQSFTSDKSATPLTYTISSNDLGTVVGFPPAVLSSEVRAAAQISGVSVRDDGGDPEGGFAGQNFDTLVLSPCVKVIKSVECDISAPGYEVDYKIRIENCGDAELQLQSIVDTLASPLLTDPNLYELAILSECEFLDPVVGTWDDPNYCEITYSLEVLEEDLIPDPNLVNEVTAVYDVIGTDLSVEDFNDVVVDLIDPNFTVDKICVDEPLMVGDDANFLITIENIGTVALILDSDEITIEPNRLEPDDIFMTNVLQTVETCDDASNTIFVSAILPPELCFELDEPLLKDAYASCEVIEPNFTVEKNCLNDPVPADANAMFEIIITNTSCGDVDLVFDVNDPAAPDINGSYGPIAPLGTVEIPIELPSDCEEDESIINIVYVEAFYDSNSIGTKEATAECPVQPCGNEGCTPGYWKNSTDCWCDEYSSNPKLCTVFALNCDTTPNDKWERLGQKKMKKALSFKGGKYKFDKLKIMLRHAVAAILNACNNNVAYPDSVDNIIAEVDDILLRYQADSSTVSKTEILALKNKYEDWNELGCPISSENSANPCQREDD